MNTWGVYNEQLILVSSRDGVSEEQAKEMADRWNTFLNVKWYVAREMYPGDKTRKW